MRTTAWRGGAVALVLTLTGAWRATEPSAQQATFCPSRSFDASAVPALRENHNATRAAIYGDGRAVLAIERVSGHAALARVLKRAEGDHRVAELDTTFGDGGLVTIDKGNATKVAVAGAAVQPDDGLVVALTRSGPGTATSVELMRFAENGEVDTSFGLGGTDRLDMGSGARDEGRDLVLQPDGKPVVVGSRTTSDNRRRGLIARRLAMGGADPAFGQAGFVTIDAGYSEGGTTRDALLAPDSKLVVSLEARDGTATHRLIRRYTSQGAVDRSFGAGGQVTDITTGVHLALQDDGRLLVAGASGNRAVLERLTSAGALDKFFAGGGSSTIPFRDATAFYVSGVEWRRNVAFVTGTASFPPDTHTTPPPATNFQSAVARFTPDGRKDGFWLPELPGATNASGSGFPMLTFASVLDVGDCVLLVGAHAGYDFPRTFNAVTDSRVPGVAAPDMRGYVVDSHGGLHPWGGRSLPAPARITFYEANRARGLLALPSHTGGYVLGANGALHPYAVGSSAMPPAAVTPDTWGNADLARGAALLPSGTGGYVLDTNGGLHPFAVGPTALPPRARLSWYATDRARALLMLPDGSGGYVLEGNGRLHAFAIGDRPMPAPANTPETFGTSDVARAVAWLPGAASGYVLDSAGGLHRFAVGDAPLPERPQVTWYKANTVRGLVVRPDGLGGYILDGAGRLNPFTTDWKWPAYAYAADAWPADLARGIVAL